ncbi:MAG: RcnB family protein [Pseudomonadota bacterium]
MAILKKVSTGIAAAAIASTAFTPIAHADRDDRKRVRGDNFQKSNREYRGVPNHGKTERVRRTGPGGVKAYGGNRADRKTNDYRGDKRHSSNDRSRHNQNKNHNRNKGYSQGKSHYQGDRKHYSGGQKHHKGHTTHYSGKHNSGKHYSGVRSNHGYKNGYKHGAKKGYSHGYNQGYRKGHHSSNRHYYKPRTYSYGHYKPRYSYRPVYSFYRPHRVFKHYSKPIYHHTYRPHAHYVPRYSIGGYYGYHGNTIILSNYRYYDLYDPPHGYHWVRDHDSGDAILASIATGAVIGLIIGAIASN